MNRHANTGAVLLAATIIEVALTEEQADFISRRAEEVGLVLTLTNTFELLESIKSEGYVLTMVENELMTPEEGAEALGF